MTTLDVEFARSQFEVFSHPDRAAWAHFENAGGSYLPRQVTDRLNHLYTKVKLQPYGPGALASEAGQAMDRSKLALAAMLNADADELSIGPSTTQNTYVLSHALRAEMREGDEIVVTNQDHEANIGAWRRLAETGIEIREWKVQPETGLLDIADFEALLGDRTKLVCMTHAGNVPGTINPVARVTELAHSVGARSVIDGVAWAPHAFVDVKALDADFYLMSTYKTYGPHLGLLFSKRRHLESIANQGHFFNAGQLNSRLTPAGPQHVEIGAAEGILDYYRALDSHHFDTEAADSQSMMERVFAMFAKQEERLMAPILEVLNGRSDVQVIGATVADRTVRAPTIAFRSFSLSSAEIVAALSAAKIGCNNGHFYAYRLLEAMGIDLDDGVVRLSAVHYNSEAEVERAANALQSALNVSKR